MASPAVRPVLTDGATPVLVVEVGGNQCGLVATDVVELHRMVATAPLPGAPSTINGAIDVHGTLVAVLDMRRRFGLPSRDITPDDYLVLVRVKERTVALRVDRIVDLVNQDIREIDVVGFTSNGHLLGVGRLETGLILIHDVGAFLSDTEVADLDELLSSFVPDVDERA